MTGNTKKIVMDIVLAALLAALACVATMLIQIPTPFKGYVNLGDGIVLVAGWILAPKYVFLAAGVGSALADLILGYVTYAPATFLIKGAMALIVCYGYTWLHHKLGHLPSRILTGAVAEIVMVLGYCVFESILYGFAVAALNLFSNSVQAVVGLVIGVVLIEILDKSKALSRLK